MFTKRIPLEERFAKKVATGGPDECWQWLGRPNRHGYGEIRNPGKDGKMMLAHRLAYKLANGILPVELCVCHTCDNRICVNPKHLFLGTNYDNVQDRHRKGKSNGRGLPGEGCGHAKLKDAQVLMILGDTRSIGQIATAYGVAHTTISNIKRGRTWKHLRTIGKWKD